MDSYLPLHVSESAMLPAFRRSMRRSVSALCLIYLILIGAQAGNFALSDLAALREHEGDALAALTTANEAADDPRVATFDAARQAQLKQNVAQAQQEWSRSSSAATRGWGRLLGMGTAAFIILGFWLFSLRRLQTHKEFINIVTLMIVLAGVPLIASRLLLYGLNVSAASHVAWGLLDILVLHLVACLVLPWTARESVQPAAVLLAAWAIALLLEEPGLNTVVAIIVSPIVLLPGALIASWRARRRSEDLERMRLGHQVRTLGGELSRARIVHDAMFPREFHDGHVSFEFIYRPIQEIGGDYVHLHQAPNGAIYLTLLDVAGHGLAAALTVNRLFGELERIRAEQPDATPGRLMKLLNRYINLTMSRHSMFATGACFMLDPQAGKLSWVNAGHPPALLRKADGRVLDLPGTTMLLGVLNDHDFKPGERTVEVAPGDVVIAYTDGAYEARDRTGMRFGLNRVRETCEFSPPPRSWTRFISQAVEKHHHGRAEDDVLIATLCLHSMKIDTSQPAVDASVASRPERASASTGATPQSVGQAS